MSSASSRRRRALVPLALAAVALSGMATLSSGAWFTDSASITSNTFTAGTVDLAASPGTAALTMSDMAPGDTTYAAVAVKNTGSLAERYAVTESATDADSKALASALTLDVEADAATCDAAGFAAGTPLTAAGTTFDTATVFGDPTQGAQPGDRALAAGASETLCFKVSMPLDAPNSVQGGTTTGTLTFHAEQTANN